MYSPTPLTFTLFLCNDYLISPLISDSKKFFQDKKLGLLDPTRGLETAAASLWLQQAVGIQIT